MLRIIIGVVSAIIAIIVGFFFVQKWEEIREEVKNWLHENNLEKSSLMNVWVEFVMVGDAIHKIVKVKTISKQIEVVFDKTVMLNEIDDADVLRELEKRGAYQEEITQMFI